MSTSPPLRPDPGIQVVRGDTGPEVDARGIQHQPYDRNALLEDIEAHFQANFQPDEGLQISATSQPQIDQGTRASSSGRWSTNWQRNTVLSQTLCLKLALAVISLLAIAAAVLAGLYAHRRSSIAARCFTCSLRHSDTSAVISLQRQSTANRAVIAIHSRLPIPLSMALDSPWFAILTTPTPTYLACGSINSWTAYMLASALTSNIGRVAAMRRAQA